MTEQTKCVDVELVPNDKLIEFANKTGLETSASSSLVAAFKPVFDKARKVIDDARGVAESVNDATCVTQIKKARACRLAIRAVRLEGEKTHEEQKKHALLYGRAVDGFRNILLLDLKPVEDKLQEAEDFAERAEAKRMADLKAAREAELLPLLDGPILADLSRLSQEDFNKALADAKLLRQAKIDAAAKAEEEAKAKAEADRIERERIAAENARLKAEAEAREAAAKAEREEAARKLAAEREVARLAQEAADRKLAEERAAAEQARKQVEAKAKAEREAAEAKAAQERAKVEQEAKKERDRLQAIADEERRKLAAAEAQAKSLRDAEAKRIADAEAASLREKQLSEAAARKAAAAPDNAKAEVFAASLRALVVPKFTTKRFSALPGKIEELAKWIESQANGELL